MADGKFRPAWRVAALLAILCYLCLPITTLHSQSVLTDPVLVFYSTLLLWAVVSSHNRNPWVIGLCAGIVISIKYTGIIWVAIVLVADLIIRRLK